MVNLCCQIFSVEFDKYSHGEIAEERLVITMERKNKNGMESLAFAAPIAPDHHQLIVVIAEGERSSVLSVFSCVFFFYLARKR